MNNTTLEIIETLKAYDDLILRINSLVRTLQIYPKVFVNDEHHYKHQFFDITLFSVLNHLDLIIGLKYLDLSKALGNTLEANYFARVIALNSYEILSDLNKLVGKEVRIFVISKIGENGVFEIDESIRTLNSIKKDKIKRLKAIRNNLLGHKLINGYQQIEMIIDINLKEIYDIGKQIFEAQMNLIKNYTLLIEKL